jgi:hypothetical protein
MRHKQHTGEITLVTISMAGIGNKRVRVANLPPEVPDNDLKAALAPYGTVIDIQEKKWSRAYRYVVANGIRQVMIMLTRHIPSHFTVDEHSVLLSYEGQPTTCYGCGDIGHLYPTCPRHRKTGSVTTTKHICFSRCTENSTDRHIARMFFKRGTETQ